MSKKFFIIMLILMPILAFSNTWYVGANCRFQEIQEAIDNSNVLNGDIIIVNSGTYNPINLGTKVLTIQANTSANVVIDGNGNSSRCVVLTEEIGLDTELIDITIQNSDHGGIYLANRPLTLYGCTIENCETSSYGGGIYSSGDLRMYNTDIISCVAYKGGGMYISSGSVYMENCTISNCIAELDNGPQGGGIFCKNHKTDPEDFQIVCSTINNCFSDGQGGALYSDDSSFLINGTTFSSNQSGTNGGAICVSLQTVYSNEYIITGCLFHDNIAGSSGGAMSISLSTASYTDYYYITNTTIENNSANQQDGCNLFANSNGYIEISNSIIRDESATSNVDYNNCCLWDGASGYNSSCFVDDPEFVDEANDDYHLQWYSPCLDAGQYSSTFPDNENDLGCFQLPHSEWEFTQNGTGIPVTYDWRSFPRLNTGNPNDGDFVDAIAMLDKFEYPDNPTGIEIWYQKNELVDNPDIHGDWNYGNEWYDWTPSISNDYMCSTRGYKLKVTDPTDDPTLRVLGDVCVGTTPITIDVEDNSNDWVGYFLEDTQFASTAFDTETLNKLDKIMTKNWTAVKFNNTWAWPYKSTLSYGDLVILSDYNQTTNFTFYWQEVSRDEIEPYVRPVPTQFTYNEDLNYMPIYMEFAEIPLEIGVYVNGVCRGAEVVDFEENFHLRAYVYEEEPGYDLEFVQYFGRSETKVLDYEVVNMPGRSTDKLVTGSLSDWARIRFGDPAQEEVSEQILSLNAYPNPFNPDLKIEFSTTEDSENTELAIYNLKGQRVKSFKIQNSKSKIQHVVWNGKDDIGNKISGGVYFLRLQTGRSIQTQKVVLLK